ncbi:superoxide dismutase [Cu-Zn]-like [Brevipalpus obovatus]|uniref:superoxide dismutase [Cu-Zn]-like n=1 Tax=Brevipalpus obovatus TaxID=246614 RepID=UPI003D9EF7FE
MISNIPILSLTLLLVLIPRYLDAQDAHVNLRAKGNEGLVGSVHFHYNQGKVHITGQVSGLSPGHHGFHVHEFGDLSEGCTSFGGHFNPEKKDHAGPLSAMRHGGDLGNIEADANGIARINIVDAKLGQFGADAIKGLGLVVHEKEDDLGMGPAGSDTKKTGNAGGRYACGVIGLAKPMTHIPQARVAVA